MTAFKNLMKGTTRRSDHLTIMMTVTFIHYNEECLFINPKINDSLFTIPTQLPYMLIGNWSRSWYKRQGSDIRKYTAPCSLQQDMLVVDLTKFSIGILQGYLVPLYADWHTKYASSTHMLTVIGFCCLFVSYFKCRVKIKCRMIPPRSLVLPRTWGGRSCTIVLSELDSEIYSDNNRTQ